MSEISQPLSTIKRQLKLQGKTHRDLADDVARMQAKLRQLRARFAVLHKASPASPLALREWQSAALKALRP
jgi:hypothetical protein